MIELTFRVIEERSSGTLAKQIMDAPRTLAGGWEIRDVSHAIAVDADGCVIHREALVTFWRKYHHLNPPDDGGAK